MSTREKSQSKKRGKYRKLNKREAELFENIYLHLTDKQLQTLFGFKTEYAVFKYRMTRGLTRIGEKKENKIKEKFSDAPPVIIFYKKCENEK